VTCPASKRQVFVVSFGAGESKTRKELHKHILRPYHDTISTKGYHSARLPDTHIRLAS
jgi:hypothetical protein